MYKQVKLAIDLVIQLFQACRYPLKYVLNVSHRDIIKATCDTEEQKQSSQKMSTEKF